MGLSMPVALAEGKKKKKKKNTCEIETSWKKKSLREWDQMMICSLFFFCFFRLDPFFFFSSLFAFSFLFFFGVYKMRYDMMIENDDFTSRHCHPRGTLFHQPKKYPRVEFCISFHFIHT